MTTRRLVPLSELARRLRVPAPWLRIQANSGRLPSVHADKQILFDAETVEQILLERAAAGGPKVVKGVR